MRLRSLAAGFLLAGSLAGARGACGAETPTWLADLSPEVAEAIRSANRTGNAQEILKAILDAAPGYRFDTLFLTAYTDRRWYSTESGTGLAAPVLELRRWPGDTVLALYVLLGEQPTEGSSLSQLPGAKLGSREEFGPGWRWEGTLDTAMGPRPAIWIERAVAQSGNRLAALLLPGDAGLGGDAVSQLREELLAVFERLEIRAESWRGYSGVPQAVPVVLPNLDSPPAALSEKRDPWQVVTGAGGYTLGLPPGLRARRLDLGIPPPRELPGASLWIRGRFVDRDGLEVRVGDGERTGYVAEIPVRTARWSSGEAPPLGASKATHVDGDSLETLIGEWTGASAGRVDHWREAGFDGDWLTFRLSFAKGGVEIGLPVLTGWRSLALFWVPFTWRAPGLPAAPPPIDPAERFGIRFKQLSRIERQRNPLVQGYLTAPGVRAELPLGWWPVASLRTTDGFPVTFVDARGRTMARLVRIHVDHDGPPEPASHWFPIGRPSAHGAKAVYAGKSGERLYVAPEGHAILLEPAAGSDVPQELWSRVADAVMLTRPRP